MIPKVWQVRQQKNRGTFVRTRKALMKDHPTRAVARGGYRADIDVGLAPLIECLWGRGIVTMNSCQEISRGVAYIEFPLVRYGELFLSAVHKTATDALQQRIFGKGRANNWRYEFQLESLFRDHRGNHVVRPVYMKIPPKLPVFDSLIFSVSIYFPKTDIRRILQAVSSQ